MRFELIYVCSLNGFQLVIGLYRGLPLLFLECVYLSLFYSLFVFLFECGCTTWTDKKKARWELHKNATCCFKQILEASPQKAAAEWPLTSHLKNDPSKTNKT